MQKLDFKGGLEHPAHAKGGDFAERSKQVGGERFDEGGHDAGKDSGGSGGYLGMGCDEGEEGLVDIRLDIYRLLEMRVCGGGTEGLL